MDGFGGHVWTGFPSRKGFVALRGTATLRGSGTLVQRSEASQQGRKKQYHHSEAGVCLEREAELAFVWLYTL